MQKGRMEKETESMTEDKAKALAEEIYETIQHCGFDPSQIAEIILEGGGAGVEEPSAPQPPEPLKFTNEKEKAIYIADRVLDAPNVDPDSYECILARQFLRSIELRPRSVQCLSDAVNLIHSEANRSERGGDAKTAQHWRDVVAILSGNLLAEKVRLESQAGAVQEVSPREPEDEILRLKLQFAVAECYWDDDTRHDSPEEFADEHDLPVGAEFELQAATYWGEKFRVTKRPDEINDDYECEQIGQKREEFPTYFDQKAKAERAEAEVRELRELLTRLHEWDKKWPKKAYIVEYGMISQSERELNEICEAAKSLLARERH